MSFGVRFQWQGKRRYRTLGSSAGGWTKQMAQKEIDRLMALLVGGAWDPDEDERRESEPERELVPRAD